MWGTFLGISWGIQWLVGGLEHYLFPFSWECHHPNWLIFFRGVGQPPCLAYLVSTLFPHDLRSWTPIPRTATADRGQVEASAAWSAACSFRFPVTGAVNLATAWGNSCETAGICPENGGTLGPAGPVGLESQSTQILAHTRRTGSSWLVVWNMAFIFHNIWDYPSHWLTTNQDCLSTYFCKMNQCSWENLGWRIFSHPNEGDSGPRSSGRRSSIPTACYQALLHPWVWDSSGGAVQNFAKNPVGFPILNWHLRWVPRSCCSGSDSCGRSVCWIPPTDHFPRSYEFLISVKPRLLGHLPSGND